MVFLHGCARHRSRHLIGEIDPSDYAPKEFIVQLSDREISRFSQRFLAVSKMFTAVVSRPRRSTDRRFPDGASTVGDGGRKGRAGEETVPEPAWRRQLKVAAMGQSDPLLRIAHGQGSVRRRRLGVDPPGLGRVGDERSFLAWDLRY
jgi:hypothetical protein